MLPAYLPDITVHRRFRVAALGQRRGWHLDEVQAARAWEQGLRGEGCRVGVVDTGMDQAHLVDTGDLHGQVFAARGFAGTTHAHDRHGHGTHVAGIIGALQNLSGIEGVAHRSRLAVAQGLGVGGSGSDMSIVSAIDWLVEEQGVHVINLSLGSPSESRRITAAVERAIAAGVHIVCAAGNDGDNRVSWPAHHPGTISVGALDRGRRPASFSSPSRVDVAAPGVRIESTYLDGGYAELSGTSMAAPVVTGLIALYVGWEIEQRRTNPSYPRVTPGEMQILLRQAAIDIFVPGFDAKTGAGLIGWELYRDLKRGADPPQDPPPGGDPPPADTRPRFVLRIGATEVSWPVEVTQPAALSEEPRFQFAKCG